MIAKNEQETKNYAKKILKNSNGSNIFALYGDLGSGKTTFVQGLAKALEIEKRVLSPTFVFQRSYSIAQEGFTKFHHLDLYRLKDLSDALSIGVDEIFAEKESLIAIEWPEIIEEILPEKTIKIRFKKLDGNKREIRID